MNKNAKELIQKMAGVSRGASSLAFPAAGKKALQDTASNKKLKDVMEPKLQRLGYGHAAGKQPPGPDRDWMISRGKSTKESSMRSIIDDLIKGAKDNSFGRPVSIQQYSEFTPIDMAKIAGAVVALSEKGATVKEAAEYLGLTEAQLQDIVSTVG